MTRKCFIYGLREPNGPIRYVGKTTSKLEARLSTHKSKATPKEQGTMEGSNREVTS